MVGNIMRLDELVNQYYNQLNENDIYIWNYISSHKKECEKLAIDHLAYKCNVSRTTILRFAQKLSLKGYGELKVYLKLDNQMTKENTNNVNFLCNSYNDLMKSMSERDCTEIFEAFDNAKNLYVFGSGMVQSSIKKEIKRIFLLGKKIFYDISGYDEAKAIVKMTTQDDLCIVISVSGENEFTIDFTKELKIRNVKTISITKSKDNSLARLCDHNLYVSTPIIDGVSDKFKYESVTSYFMLIEILFLKYMEHKSAISKKED